MRRALEPRQLGDRARRGQGEIELHTTPEVLGVDVGWARDFLAEYGVTLVTVHAPLSAHLGNLDPALEECARSQVLATAKLADALVPPGRERLVPVHLAPTVFIGDVASGGDEAVRARRLEELRAAARSALWLARVFEPRGGPVRFCLENHALFETGVWDPGSPRFGRAFCSGRFPWEFALLAELISGDDAGSRVGFILDVCHAMSALAGAVWMRASGERFALVLPEDLHVDGRPLELADWFRAVGPRLGVVHLSRCIGLGAEPGQHAVPLGEADLGLAREVVRCLDMVGFSGPVVIEVQEPDVTRAVGSENTERVLRQAVLAGKAAVAAGCSVNACFERGERGWA